MSDINSQPLNSMANVSVRSIFPRRHMGCAPVTSDRSQPFISLTSSHVSQPEGERDCSTVWCCWTDLLYVLHFFELHGLGEDSTRVIYLDPLQHDDHGDDRRARLDIGTLGQMVFPKRCISQMCTRATRSFSQLVYFHICSKNCQIFEHSVNFVICRENP